MTVGESIKNTRLRSGLTQKQVADACGMADSAIRKYESGKVTPKYETLKRIAAALDVEWTELVPEDEQTQQIADHIREGLKKSGPMKQISIEEAHKRGLINITFKSEEDRIAYFYGKLNTDGRLIASKCFYQHLDKDSVGEVADYIEKLSEIPQYQLPATPQSPPALQGGHSHPTSGQLRGTAGGRRKHKIKPHSSQ